MTFRIYYYDGNQRLLETRWNSKDPVGDIWNYVRMPEQETKYGVVDEIRATEPVIKTEVYVDDMVDMFTDKTTGYFTTKLDISSYTTGEVLWKENLDPLDPDFEPIPLQLLKRQVIKTSISHDTLHLYI